MLTSIWNFIKGFFRRENYNLRNYTCFILVLMCIQYIPLESRAGVSPIKVAMMAITPFIWLRFFAFTKAFVIGLLYVMWVFFTAYVLHPLNFRASTVIYFAMFVCTYAAFYNFVWVQEVFTLPFFIRFLRGFIYVLVVVLILQQISIIVGIRYLPIINLCQILDRGIGANSLSFEPSSLARTLLVLYYVYLKCNEYLTGDKIPITQIFSPPYRWVTIAFLWAMFTMGSGTAFICLAILSLYFMRGAYFLLAIPIFLGVYFTLDYLDVKQFNRARAVVVATSTADADVVRDVDGSAAARIRPFLNTLNIDIYATESWIGEGCDTSVHKKGFDRQDRYIGDINDFGIIALILSYLLVFGCAIRFRSLASIMFFAGVGGGTGNISYAWGLLMLFTVLRYFYNQSQLIPYGTKHNSNP